MLILMYDEFQANLAIDTVRQLFGSGKRYTVEFKEYKARRTVAQNRLMWMWYDEIKAHVRETTGQFYSSDEIHDFMKSLFLPSKVIKLGNIHKATTSSTAVLSIPEFTEYLEHIDAYCADSLNLMLTRPDVIYQDAMMDRRRKK